MALVENDAVPHNGLASNNDTSISGSIDLQDVMPMNETTKLFRLSVLAAAVGLTISIGFCLRRDAETVEGMALVTGVFYLVSVVLVLALDAVAATHLVKVIAFASPVIFMLAVTAIAKSTDADAINARGASDGGGEFAQIVLEGYLVGLVPALACLVALVRRGNTASAEIDGRTAKQSVNREQDTVK